MKFYADRKTATPLSATIVRALLFFSVISPIFLHAHGDPDAPLIIRTNVAKDVRLGVPDGQPETTHLPKLTITETFDTGGHAPFVLMPPTGVALTVSQNFEIGLSTPGNLGPGWLLFDSMPLDSNFEFRGQNRATVAGFDNILTVVSGIFTPDGISGTFEIGADGGLPGGQSLTHKFLIDTAVGLELVMPISSFLSVSTEIDVGISILEVPKDEKKPEHFYLEMHDGIHATAADWWLVMLQGGEILSFDLDTGMFVPGLRPTYQGPTLDFIEPVRFWSLPESQSEEFTLFFGIDTIQDGVVNEPQLWGSGFTYYFL